MDGVRDEIKCYEKQFQAIFPFRRGHVSVGVASSSDVGEVGRKIVDRLTAER